jgi:hypothetical protein
MFNQDHTPDSRQTQLLLFELPPEALTWTHKHGSTFAIQRGTRLQTFGWSRAVIRCGHVLAVHPASNQFLLEYYNPADEYWYQAWFEIGHIRCVTGFMKLPEVRQ